MPRVLLVEDRETTRLMIAETLRRRGYDVDAAGTLAEGRELLAGDPDLLLTDLQLPDGSGIHLLEEALSADPQLPAVMMSAFGTIEIALEAVKKGAYDFVPKPFDNNKLVELIGHALERRSRTRDQAAPADGEAEDPGGILGVSAAIRRVRESARRVATSDATVLLLGESGTGKEVVARALHRWSGRAEGPWIAVNCAAVPGELMEAEFFGAERGAYTGAVARKLGKVEVASGGTLFLDEIGELAADMQAKLLRVLQERTFTRVGGTEEIHSDVRIVAATNRDLEAQVRSGSFREDLFYRLNVFPIRLPALDERPDDIGVLAREFVAVEARRQDRALRITEEALEALAGAAWPGNVRQLRNAIERAIILADDGAIRPEHFDELPAAPVREPSAEVEALPAGVTLLDVGRDAARRAESVAIRKALALTNGNRTEAARRLGISYKTLWSKIKEYELE